VTLPASHAMPTPPQAATVSVNGAEIAYRFDGPAGGRVVLMSNSLMSSYDMWDWTLPALADRYLGDASLAWRISQFNGAAALRPGQTVVVPLVERNPIGVYANGYQIAEIFDSKYTFGRYGVFVSPETTVNYTYRVVQMSYWDLTNK